MNTYDNASDMRFEADRERARADRGEGLADLRAASIRELAELAAPLRCQAADLADDVHNSASIPMQRLQRVTARLARRADTLNRAAQGYTKPHADDIAFPRISTVLEDHGWTPVPDWELDGTEPPIPSITNHRGYRRGWRRHEQTITLWFTGPYAVAYAANGHERLLTTHQEIMHVLTAPIPFDATYSQVVEHMRDAGWIGPFDEQPCDRRGKRRSNGRGRQGWWFSSAHGYRVYAWGVGDEPAHVSYGYPHEETDEFDSLASMDALCRRTAGR